MEQNKAQYDLNRETARISVLTLKMLVNMNLWLGKMLHQKKTC